MEDYRRFGGFGLVSTRGIRQRKVGSVLICLERSAPVPGRSNVIYQAAYYSSIICISNIAAAGDGRTPTPRKSKLGHCRKVWPPVKFDTGAITKIAKGAEKGNVCGNEGKLDSQKIFTTLTIAASHSNPFHPIRGGYIRSSPFGVRCSLFDVLIPSAPQKTVNPSQAR
jgi:hypothetical protein